MKILMLSPYYYPEQVSSSHLKQDLEKALANAGFVQENYVPTPSRGITAEERKRYSKKKTEISDDGRIFVHRFSMFREGKNPFLRAIRYILVNIIQYFKGTHVRDIDLIFAASTPPTQGLLCGLVKRQLEKRTGRKIPFVYNLQDIFPDSLVNTGLARKNSLLWKIGRKIEDFTYRNADRIIVISEDFKQNILAKGVPEEKIVVIPNWVDTNDVYPIPREENILFDRYGIDRSKFIISYCGNIGHTQNMDLLLDVAKQLQNESPDILFVLIGEGAAWEIVEQRIVNESIKNVRLLPFQPYEDISHVFSLGDVGLIISKPGIGNNSVPSKTWSYMAAGRPLLASFDLKSSLTELIGKVECGIACDAGGEKELSMTIRKMHDDQSQTKEMGTRGFKYVTTSLKKEDCVLKYIQVISSMCD